MSETATSRRDFEKWFKGFGIDLGFGGDLCHPSALGMDFVSGSYGSVGGDKQTLRGDVRRLPFLCDDSVDYLHSSHVLEDSHWDQLPEILQEYHRVLKPNGNLLINCPDEIRYRKHCRDNNAEHLRNLAHANEDFTLANFMLRVVGRSGPWEVEFVKEQHGAYSWLLTLRKIKK